MNSPKLKKKKFPKLKKKPSLKKETSVIAYRDGAEGCIRWIEENCFIPIYPEGSDIPVWTRVGLLPDEMNPKTGKNYRGIWNGQKEILRKALIMKRKRFVYRLIVFCWMRGEGKCQAKGSKILMFDGTIKKVEDIVVGDSLMGDDNTPREVLSLASGVEEMFKITPIRGESLTVTKDHILSLKGRRRFKNRRGKPYYDLNEDKITDISLKDYMKKNDSFKRYHLLYKVPINFPDQSVDIEPYYLGLWLGDGSSNCTAITSMEPEIINYLQGYADRLGLKFTNRGKKNDKARTYNIVCKKGGLPGRNSLLNSLNRYNLIGNKHIPQEYKINSRENRLKLLAGIVDSDGYINRNSIQILLKSKVLSEDILFLARSLGFHAEMKKCIKSIKSIGFSGEYYRIGISGDCSIVPTQLPRKKILPRKNQKNVLVTGIKEIKSVGKQEYYGFTLNSNGRYVTGNFMVTHNSLLACLVQLWKFFCFPKQQIMLGANSKEQTKFVHYDIMRDIILNSPNLLEHVGRRNIQEKEIRIRDESGEIVSFVRSISSFSGIVSNITGYTFSEMFDMKNPKFYVQLDGSIRNMPNSFGVIDSTVSDKKHVLYQLYTNAMAGKTKTVFFSYRFSKTGFQEDYWNPNMDSDQLEDYRVKFPFGDFERYFLNLWEAGRTQVFTQEMVEEIGIIGVYDKFLNHYDIKPLLKQKHKLFASMEGLQERNLANVNLREIEVQAEEINSKFRKVDTLYTLNDTFNTITYAPMNILDQLSDIFDTDWSILIGLDMGDPLAVRGLARTILTCVAKGLPGSRKNPDEEIADPKYIYLLLHLTTIEKHSLDVIKSQIDKLHIEYDGIDIVCSERYGAWDLVSWCDERDIKFEPIFPNYDRQREAFKEIFTVVYEGRFKAPELFVPGSKNSDILREEFLNFDHDPHKRWFGSPEKFEKYGIQDDSIYSLGWSVYGGRMLTAFNFKPRTGTIDFGTFQTNKALVAHY